MPCLRGNAMPERRSTSRESKHCLGGDALPERRSTTREAKHCLKVDALPALLLVCEPGTPGPCHYARGYPMSRDATTGRATTGRVQAIASWPAPRHAAGLKHARRAAGPDQLFMVRKVPNKFLCFEFSRGILRIAMVDGLRQAAASRSRLAGQSSTGRG